jgi:hypothetical protein
VHLVCVCVICVSYNTSPIFVHLTSCNEFTTSLIGYSRRWGRRLISSSRRRGRRLPRSSRRRGRLPSSSRRRGRGLASSSRRRRGLPSSWRRRLHLAYSCTHIYRGHIRAELDQVRSEAQQPAGAHCTACGSHFTWWRRPTHVASWWRSAAKTWWWAVTIPWRSWRRTTHVARRGATAEAAWRPRRRSAHAAHAATHAAAHAAAHAWRSTGRSALRASHTHAAHRRCARLNSKSNGNKHTR